ncbi:MAG: hypothetical protein M5T61_00940 [Acidimicrobiia bacterium]|nr:hypothetical protein [Acidimicrobiia bacterium]
MEIDALVLLRAALAELCPPAPSPSANPAEFAAWAADLRVRRQRALELEEAALGVFDEQLRAGSARRRIEARVRRVERSLDGERRRVEGTLYAQQRHRGAPVRVVVHAEAWTIVSADAIRRRRSVGDTLGALLTRVVEVGVAQFVEADQRGAGTSTDDLRALQVRPVLDAEVWSTFRSEVRRLGIRVARAVGLVIEQEARRLGWR